MKDYKEILLKGENMSQFSMSNVLQQQIIIVIFIIYKI